MYESCRRIYQTPPQVLAEMMAVESAPLLPWRADELGLIFEHQLKAPLIQDLEVLAPAFADRLRDVTNSQNHAAGSFLDLFQDAAPSLDVLTVLQEFTEFQLAEPESLMPPEFAKVLGLACATLAWRRHHRLLGKLTPESLRDELTSAIRLPWLGGPVKEMFFIALHEFEGPQPSVTVALQPAAT